MKLFEIPIYYRTRADSLEEKYWRVYDYNEVIGWVALYPRPQAIRAEHWTTLQRPSKVLIRKQFDPKGKLFQIRVRGLSDNQIYERLINAFEDTKKYSYLSKYHFDLEAFKTTGKFVNWRNVLETAKSA